MDIRSTDNRLQDQPPWYRQFWPWFLISLPLVVVIAGFNMLYIALKYPHSMVDDQYYKEGLAINQSLDQDRRAAELKVAAEILFQPFEDAGRAQLLVNLSGLVIYPTELTLLLQHPGSQSLDQTLTLKQAEALKLKQTEALTLKQAEALTLKQAEALTLKQAEAGQYSAQLTQQYQHSYYLRLLPPDKSWRLNGKINFQYDRLITLSPK